MTLSAGTDPSALEMQTATTLQKRVAAGEVTWSQVLESNLARVAQREPVIQAFTWHDPIQVRQQLAAASSASPLPLTGVTVGIKDIIDTAQMPTAYGSKAYAGHQPATDADVVVKLKAAGALLMGKTVTTEFAHQHAGPTVNPHNFAHTPGGSSSGSAAAVADGMVMMALGSQTGGSTIRPAAFCGIVGFKPTYQRVSLQGVLPLSVSMDTIGLQARSMADVQLLASVLLGQARPADLSTPSKIRLAWYPGPEADQADADARQMLERAREVLSEQGVEFVTLNLAEKDFVRLGQANRVIMAYEAARQHQAIYRSHPTKLGESTVKMIESGLAMTEAQYRQELTHAAHCRALFSQAMQGVDAALTFSAPGQAPLKTTGTGLSTFNRAWTTTGVPCLTLPVGKGSLGLPLGVQFVADTQRDHQLLALGEIFEAMLGR